MDETEANAYEMDVFNGNVHYLSLNSDCEKLLKDFVNAVLTRKPDDIGSFAKEYYSLLKNKI